MNKDVSYRLFKEKVADPLGMDVYVAAETCLELLNVMMREHLVRSLMVGHDLREYVLLGYGGGGPLHLLGYAGDHPWKAVCTVPHAGAFSAWGGACMDYSHRRHKSVQALLQPDLDDATRLQYVAPVAQAWRDLEKELLAELEGEGFARDQISLHQRGLHPLLRPARRRRGGFAGGDPRLETGPRPVARRLRGSLHAGCSRWPPSPTWAPTTSPRSA